AGAAGGQHNPHPLRFITPRVGLENDPSLHTLLDGRGISYEAEGDESPLRSLGSLLVSTAMLVGLFLAGFLLLRWLSGGSSPLTFGRSRHRLYAQKDMPITFNDVAGIDEAVAELREVVDFLNNPHNSQPLRR